MIQKTVDSKEEFTTKEEYQNKVADMRDKANEVKQHLMDSSMIVKKETEGIVIKIRNYKLK